MEGEAVLGKVPPHNLEAEQAVLGSILLDNEVLDRAIDFLRADDFYRKSHQKIFSTMVDLDSRKEPIDIITVVDLLKREHALESCGGAVYISELSSRVPSSANVAYYAEMVRSLSIRRKLIRAATGIIEETYSDSTDYKQVLAEAEKAIFDITDEHQRNRGYQSAKDVVSETVNTIEKLYQAGGEYTGIPSGFPELDSMTSGFQPSDFVVIGARPSVGKTAFALTIAAHMAVDKQVPVGFFTLEMPAKALMQRLLSIESKIDLRKIRSGMLKHADFPILTDAASRLYDTPLFIEDMPSIKLLDLRAQARRMRKNEKVEAIFIDYIGLINPESRGNVPRHEQVAEISRSMKSLARELDIPIICLSQVGRQSEGKEPTLADLRESGSIEQDADVVIFIHRDRGLESEQQDQQKLLETDIVLAKQRNGPVGHFKLGFVKRFATFESLYKGRHSS